MDVEVWVDVEVCMYILQLVEVLRSSSYSLINPLCPLAHPSDEDHGSVGCG